MSARVASIARRLHRTRDVGLSWGALRRSLSSSRLPPPPPPPPHPQGAGRIPVTWVSLGVMVVAGGAVVAYFEYEKERKSTQVVSNMVTYGKPALGGPWTLVDSAGRPVTDASLRGQWALLYFGFAHCPDICPSELQKMTQVVKRLEKTRGVGAAVVPVVISVDPKRDSVEQMHHYKQDFHPRMMALTGTPAQIEKAARHYRVYFRNTQETEDEDDDDYLVDHSIVMYLIDPEGEFQEFFTQIASADEIVERISTHVKASGYQT